MIKKNTNKLIYNYFITSFYITLLIPYIKGFLDIYLSKSIGILFLTFAQGYIYVIPLFLLFFIRTKQKKLFLIIALYAYVILAMPFSEFFNIYDFIFAWKNLLLILLNILILFHLMENDYSFEKKIEKHIELIFKITIFILLFEILSSMLWINPLYIFLRSLAGESYPLLGKANGIDLGIHTQGLLLSLGFYYYYVKKKYKMSLLMLIGLILAVVKTWLIAFTVTFVLFLFINIFNKRFYTIIISIIIIVIFTFILFPEVVRHYTISFAPTSYPMETMGGQLYNMVFVLQNSILPNGLVYNLHTDTMPNFIIGSEIYFLQILFQLGIFGFFLYMLILFSGIFNLNNKYWILIFLSLFSVLHTFALQNLYVLYIVMYFNSYSIIQSRRKSE